MKELSQRTRWWMFYVYTFIWEAFIWIGTGYLVVYFGISPWLFILAVVMSSSQFQPRSFNLPTQPKHREYPEDMSKQAFKQYIEAKKYES